MRPRWCKIMSRLIEFASTCAFTFSCIVLIWVWALAKSACSFKMVAFNETEFDRTKSAASIDTELFRKPLPP